MNPQYFRQLVVDFYELDLPPWSALYFDKAEFNKSSYTKWACEELIDLAFDAQCKSIDEYIFLVQNFTNQMNRCKDMNPNTKDIFIESATVGRNIVDILRAMK